MNILIDREDSKDTYPRENNEPGNYPTILIEVFGNSPEVRVLDFFMDHPLNDYMQSELADRTGMNPRTIRRVLEGLLSTEIIRINRKIAKSTLYKLNSKSPIVAQIKELERTASLQSIE